MNASALGFFRSASPDSRNFVVAASTCADNTLVPPLPGSPAIDAGSKALAIGSDGMPLMTDQRGYYRIFNGAVDIGAYEYGSLPLLAGDANADGKVDFADLVIVARNYGKTNATWSDGDFNNDGSVGFDDLLIVAQPCLRRSHRRALSLYLIERKGTFLGLLP